MSCRRTLLKTEDLEKIMMVAGNIQSGTTANYNDDGISQKTTIRSGVANNSDVIVPNPVKLMPYRTFNELKQPESAYVFRIRDDQGTPLFKLIEADGGIWKNEAMLSIKNYLQTELAEEIEKYNITIIASKIQGISIKGSIIYHTRNFKTCFNASC